MQSAIAISVVIPAYNEEKLIGQCLTSLLNQRFPLAWEIIVVNNNSTDKTAEIVQKFPVRLMNKHIQGVVAARQAGLTAAQGDIVTGADADCVYPPNWLQTLYDNFQKDPKIAAVGGPGEGQKNPLWAYYIYKYGFRLVESVYKLTGKVTYLPGFNFAFKRQTFLDIGGYHTYLDFGGDEWDPLKRLQKVGKIVYDPNLKIQISTRRYRVGFFRFFFVHLLYYYFFNYWLATLFHKSLIKAKAVRNI